METKYYFALGDILHDLHLTKVAARKRFGFEKKNGHYISKTGFNKLCNRPSQVKVETLNTICNAMKIHPSDLWRTDKTIPRADLKHP